MAADTHVTGTIYFLAGKSVSNYRIIAAVPDGDIDNAAGSEAVYFVPEGATSVLLPRNDGIPVQIKRGPHVLAGELLMIGVKHNGSLADVDTTGATSDAYLINGQLYDFQTGTREPYVQSDETNRNTTTGIAPATDPKLVSGQIIVTHAWGPMPPGSGLTLVGRQLIDLRTAA